MPSKLRSCSVESGNVVFRETTYDRPGGTSFLDYLHQKSNGSSDDTTDAENIIANVDDDEIGAGCTGGIVSLHKAKTIKIIVILLNTFVLYYIQLLVH